MLNLLFQYSKGLVQEVLPEVLREVHMVREPDRLVEQAGSGKADLT